MNKFYMRKIHLKSNLKSTRMAWGINEDLNLTGLFEKGYCVDVISRLHGRTNSSIAARLVRLSLIEKRSDFYKRRRVS
jgi:hypothetical protein